MKTKCDWDCPHKFYKNKYLNGVINHPVNEDVKCLKYDEILEVALWDEWVLTYVPLICKACNEYKKLTAKIEKHQANILMFSQQIQKLKDKELKLIDWIEKLEKQRKKFEK